MVAKQKKTLGQQGYMYNLIWIKRRISNALSEVGSASEMRIDWKSLQPVFLENSADVQIICKTSRINYGNEADTPWMTKFYVNVSNNLKLQLNTPPLPWAAHGYRPSYVQGSGEWNVNGGEFASEVLSLSGRIQMLYL